MRRSPGSYLRSTWPVTVFSLLVLFRQARSESLPSYNDKLTTELIVGMGTRFQFTYTPGLAEDIRV